MKENTKKNSFHLRLYDNDTLTSLHELWASGQFDSMNDLLNRVIARGVEDYYVAYGKKKALEPIEAPENGAQEIREVKARLKAMALTVDDVFVMMNVIETLTAMLFNVERARLNDEPISEAMLEQGLLSDLPEWVEEVKTAARERIKPARK